MRRPSATPALLAAIAATACSSTAQISRAPLDEGVSTTFPAQPEAVLRAARTAMAKDDIDIEADQPVDARTWMLVGFHEMTLWSYGEYVRLVIRFDASVRVTVYSERGMETNVFAPDAEDFAAELFPLMGAELGLGRSPAAQDGSGASPATPGRVAAPPSR